MPIFRYLFGVGGVLLCLMFVLDAYVPKAPPRELRDLDKSTIRITARPSGDYVIDHFPLVRNDLAVDPAEAVRRALAMMPEGDAKQTEVPAAPSNKATSAAPRKRRVAQRTQTRVASGDVASAGRSQAWSGNNWSPGWSDNASRSWNGNWSNSSSRGWRDNHWANNQWTTW
jgi:hypothetical protein